MATKYKYISCLERYVSSSLKDAGILTRPVKSNGVWCHILLPTILLLYATLYEVPLSYKLTAYVSMGLMIYSSLFIVFTSVSSLVLKDEVYGGTTASSLISSLLIYSFVDYGIIVSILLTLPTLWLYSSLLRYTLHKLPSTFTFGEAMIVVQSVVLAVFMSLAKLVVDDGVFDFVNVTICAFLLSVSLMVAALYNMNDTQRTLQKLCLVVLFGAGLCLIILHGILGRDYLSTFTHYILYNELRTRIFSSWLFLLALTVLLLFLRTTSGVKADTTTRKTFHLLASAVYLTGMLNDRQFTTLASGLVFGLIVFVEALRKSNIEPFSSFLQSAFHVYCDEKDRGVLAMTPIYLFIGLACPLFLVPSHPYEELELLSGVLSIGIGDSAASWFGSRYGTHKWRGTERTVEGTVLNIASQIITVSILHHLDVLDAPLIFLRVVIAALVSGFVEAKTDQVDNLILPLITIIMFQVTSFHNMDISNVMHKSLDSIL